MSNALFINGQWLAGAGHELQSLQPATGELLWQGNTASDAQVNEAVHAARAAAPSWAGLSQQERTAIVECFGDLLKTHSEDLAEAIALETGKPLWEARTEAAAMAGKIAISIQAQAERAGETLNDMNGATAALRHKPHGVVAVFGPYNFPAHLPNGHIVPALLAGNTIVFKPSELTPAIAVKAVQLWEQADLPKGVLNLVIGEKDTGIALAAHKDIDGLFFTGSSNTGKIIHEQFAGQPGKILALEMGGNNPLIIGEVSDLKAAVFETVQSAYITAGQRCTCARRLFVPANAQGDEFIQQLSKAVKAIKVGAPLDEPAPYMGSVISEQAAKGILNAQENLKNLGATVLVEGVHLKPGTGMISPALLDVSAVTELPDEEYFGPLLQIIRYSDFDQALEQANNTRFGLSAGLFSDNRAQYDVFYRRIRAGIVNWNKQTTGASSAAPFGGIGASGNHRASAYYAADYCAYPVSGIEAEHVALPANLPPGIEL